MKQHEDIVYACSSLKAIHATKLQNVEYSIESLTSINFIEYTFAAQMP